MLATAPESMTSSDCHNVSLPHPQSLLYNAPLFLQFPPSHSFLPLLLSSLTLLSLPSLPSSPLSSSPPGFPLAEKSG